MPKKPIKTKRDVFDSPFTHVNLKREHTSPKRVKNNTGEVLPNFVEEYTKILTNNKVAYRVIFLDQPDLVYISFQEKGNKERAKAKSKWAATKYFKDTLHPSFQKRNEYGHELKQARVKRLPELDKYGLQGKVPIPDLMKSLGATFPCSVCGKESFSLTDYEAGRCFILEGEGELNPFTKGIILCYNCYKKYIGTWPCFHPWTMLN